MKNILNVALLKKKKKKRKKAIYKKIHNIFHISQVSKLLLVFN